MEIPVAWNPLDDLAPKQREVLDRYEEELKRMNSRVNLISAQTTDRIREHHFVHALTLAHRGFPDGARVVDFGTGGGLPCIPLAIRFPDVGFIAVDAKRKKAEAVRVFANRLGLTNVDVWPGRAEDWTGSAHYAVSRATAPLTDLWGWFAASAEPHPAPESCWPPGLLALKGGDLRSEIAEMNAAYPDLVLSQIDLDALLNRPEFIGKCILHVSDPHAAIRL